MQQEDSQKIGASAGSNDGFSVVVNMNGEKQIDEGMTWETKLTMWAQETEESLES